MRRIALMVAPLLALVLVAGCSQDDDAADQPDSTASAGPSAERDESTPCAVGTWTADKDLILEAMGVTDGQQDGVDVGAEGLFSLELDPGGTVDGLWDMTILMSDPDEGEIRATIDLTFKGTWSGSDSDLELAIAEGEGEMTRTADGQTRTTDASGMFEQDELWTATCSGPTLVLYVSGDDDGVAFTRQ